MDARPDTRAEHRLEHRRSAVRTAVVWDALQASLDTQSATLADVRPLDVLDLGGGTGGFAVRVATSGHQVTVVDPSPDALASLARRASESGVEHRVRGVQGDSTDLLDVVGEASADIVLCHGVLEVVDDPDQALRVLAAALRPGGRISLLVAQHTAAVFARALAGHLADAQRLLAEADDAASGGGGRGAVAPAPRRFTEPGVVAALDATGYDVETVHGVRVFADLVPSALVDGEPGAADALLRLEAEAAGRPELRAVAAQLHVLAVRR
ncbi:MAG: methyltransferase domain-containing protein [Nocardioidaceae bacterium]